MADQLTLDLTATETPAAPAKRGRKPGAAPKEAKTPKAPKPAKKHLTQQSLDAAVWQVCNILRRSNCAGALQYIPELTWLLFLRILDEREQQEAEEAEAVGATYPYSVQAPYRWQDWAAPTAPDRVQMTTVQPAGSFFKFINAELLPHLKGLKDLPNATPRQRVIAEILSGVEKTRVDSEKNLLDVLDKIHEIRQEDIDPTHVFPISQVFEGLLLKMGEKGNDGGQFFTPREVIRLIVRTLDIKPGGTVYDPSCGTGGFLAQAYDHLLPQCHTPKQREALKHRTFYGREKENLIYPIALANLMLHGVDEPHLWHGNTLTGEATYDGLFDSAPAQFDYILSNPPFGGKEGPEAQQKFAFKTSATQVLFMQHVIDVLKPGGSCGMVLDEGVLFRTNEQAFVKTKQKLLDACDLYCIVSLPGGVFSAAGAGVKTNLLFFTKGKRTEKIWYYDLSDVKVGKRTPMTLDRFADFLEKLPTKPDSERSWTVTRAEIEARGYDLKAVNPTARTGGDDRTPAQLLDLLADQNQALQAALTQLRGLL